MIPSAFIYKNNVDKGYHEFKYGDENQRNDIMTRTIKVHFDNNEKVTSITRHDTTPPKMVPRGGSNETKTTTTLKIKSNKCYPFKERTRVKLPFPQDNITATEFDLNLCKKLKDHFENPKNDHMKKCFDPTSKENIEMVHLFEKAGFKQLKLVQQFARHTPAWQRLSFGVEKKMILGNWVTFANLAAKSKSKDKILMEKTGGSPLVSAHMILNDCYDKGLEGPLKDEDLWTETVIEKPSTPKNKEN